MKENYLILGVNGMAGHMIAQHLTEQGKKVTGFAKRHSPIAKTIIGDAMCENDIDNVLNSDSYDVIVNAIGILNTAVDRNKEVGYYLNGELPHLLARKLENRDTKLIHISSDCVFEGKRGCYTELDQTDAISMYGITKKIGEVVDNKNLTIRTSIVGPEIKENGIGLFHWFMTQKEPVYGYRNVIWSGVTTLQLAKAIQMDEESDATGLVHLCNNNFICKYELLRLFNKYCRTKRIEIKENTEVKINRSILSTRNDIHFTIPTYDKMVKEMSVWVKNHPDLYKQYLY